MNTLKDKIHLSKGHVKTDFPDGAKPQGGASLTPEQQRVAAYFARLAEQRKTHADAKAQGEKLRAEFDRLTTSVQNLAKDKAKAKAAYLNAAENARRAHADLAAAIGHRNHAIRIKDDIKRVIVDVRTRARHAMRQRIAVYTKNVEDATKQAKEREDTLKKLHDSRKDKHSKIAARRQAATDANTQLKAAQHDLSDKEGVLRVAHEALKSAKSLLAFAEGKKSKAQAAWDTFAANHPKLVK